MRIHDALMKLLIRQPFYGALASAISIRENINIKRLEMSLTPYLVLNYNPAWDKELSEAQAIGALTHELLHLLLLHSLRRNGRDPLLWAVCCDMAVNGHIPAEMLPESAVTTERIEKRAECKLERMKSAEYYYDQLSGLLGDSITLFQREGAATLPSLNGSILEADLLNEESISQVDKSALKQKMREIATSASQSGELPPELQGVFAINPRRSQIDWTTMFKRFLSGRGRMQIRATYKRDSRRFEGFPGHKRSVGLRVLVALDESGSISDEQLNLFFNELMAINRVTNAQVFVTEFDTECSEPEPADLYRHQRSRVKKGGTDFKQIFELAEKLRFFSVVIFTDGNGDAPVQVNQRVLWILTKDGKQPAGYGYSVHFEE